MPRVFSSPCSEFNSARELSRPTVMGWMPPGNRTISRTGRIGKLVGSAFIVRGHLTPMGSDNSKAALA